MQQQLKELEIKPNKLAFKVALTFSVYYIVLIYFLKLLNIDTAAPEQNIATRIITSVLTYIPFLLAIVYAQHKHRMDLGGYMTFGRGFSTGFKVGAYSGLFIGILMVLYLKVLDPTVIAQAMEVAIDQMDGDEAKIRSVKMMEPYMALFSAFGIAVTYTFFGIIASLVGASILKKEPPLELEA